VPETFEWAVVPAVAVEYFGQDSPMLTVYFYSLGHYEVEVTVCTEMGCAGDSAMITVNEPEDDVDPRPTEPPYLMSSRSGSRRRRAARAQ